MGALGSGEERQGWILRSGGEEAGGGDVLGGGGGEDKSLKQTALTAPGQQAAWGSGGNQGEGATKLEAPMPTFRWEEIQKHNLCTRQVAGHRSQGLQHHQMVQPAPGGGSGSSGTTPGKMLQTPSWPSTATSVLCASS